MMKKLLMALLMVLFGATIHVKAQSDPDHYAIAEDSWTVGPGDYIVQSGVPDCGNGDVTPWLDKAAVALVDLARTGKPINYGSLYVVLKAIVPQVQGQTQGVVREILDTIFGDSGHANCVFESVVIPASAQVLHINYFATNEGGPEPGSAHTGCGIGQDCDVGWSRFDPPIYTRRGDFVIVTSVFRNWSHNLTRVTKMDVLWYYSASK